MDKQIDSLRVSQAEKQLELREATTKRKLLALKQQLNASMSPTSETAPPISPCHTQYTSDNSRMTAMSSLQQSPSHVSSSMVQKDMGSSTVPALQPTKPQMASCQDVTSPTTSSDTHPTSNISSNSIGSPPPAVTSPHSPSHYQIRSPPPTTPLKSPPDAPSHVMEGVPSSSRNGMSALRARLMASQDSNWCKHTVSGGGGRTGRREGVKDSALPCTEGKEAEFMSVAQRQKERVQRIRRAMHAAMVIQRAWRRYRSGV